MTFTSGIANCSTVNDIGYADLEITVPAAGRQRQGASRTAGKLMEFRQPRKDGKTAAIAASGAKIYTVASSSRAGFG
jgi:hypothetical protein